MPAKKKSDLEQRMEHFSEEIESLGERFGKEMEEKGERWESWFNRTFGALGPLISSVFGVIILGLIIFVIRIINLPVGSGFLSNINSFLMANLGLFFLIMLFFSYKSYLCSAYPKAYLPFSPIMTAIGITIGFWIAARAISIANLSLGNQTLFSVVFFIDRSLYWILGFFLLLGYLVLVIKLAVGKPVARTHGRIVMKKALKAKNLRQKRLYRSGKDKILGGVCGGIAEYLDVDPVIIRLLWVVGTLAWGFGIILYIIAWIIIPRNPGHKWKD